MKFTPGEVREVTEACIVREGEHPFFDGVAIDSRFCREGQLFVALRGAKTDGHFFVSQAFENGVWGALVEKIPLLPLGSKNGTLFRVESTLAALKSLGKTASQRFQGEKIAITGTVGKTTCKHILGALLKRNFSVEITPQSFNTAIGVSCALANFSEHSQAAIVEAGISRTGEMEELAEIIEPGTVIFTAFGEGHLEGLESVEKVVEEKSKLVTSQTHCVYLNGDSPQAMPLFKLLRQEGRRVISFGIQPSNQLFLSRFALRLPQWQADFSIRWEDRDFFFTAPVLFEDELVSFLPALHLALEWGVSTKVVQEVLYNWKPLPGRGNYFFYRGGVVIDDSYNANPLSYRKALKSLKTLVRQGFEAWLVAGDMLEMGNFAPQAHRFVLREAVTPPILSGVVLFGPCFREVAEREFPKELADGFFRWFSSHREIQRFLAKRFSTCSRWVVLFKGSRGMGMENAIPEEWREGHD